MQAEKGGIDVTHREVEAQTHLSVFAEAETADRQVPGGSNLRGVSYTCLIFGRDRTTLAVLSILKR